MPYPAGLIAVCTAIGITLAAAAAVVVAERRRRAAAEETPADEPAGQEASVPDPGE